MEMLVVVALGFTVISNYATEYLQTIVKLYTRNIVHSIKRLITNYRQKTHYSNIVSFIHFLQSFNKYTPKKLKSHAINVIKSKVKNEEFVFPAFFTSTKSNIRCLYNNSSM